MRHINSFWRSYKVIMEEKARHIEYMRKIQIENILKEHNERLKRIENIKNKN
jgi:hypothetical protein